MRSFLHPLLRADDGHRCELVNDRTGAIVATDVWGAFDSAARRRGLLGRPCLPPGAALALAPCSAVHTCFMRFAIDLIFVARDGRVLALRHALPAWRAAWSIGAFAVIETAAGAAAAARVRRGDRLSTRVASSTAIADISSHPA